MKRRISFVIMATITPMALAQAPCGSFLNPCHVKIEGQNEQNLQRPFTPFEIKSFDPGGSLLQGALLRQQVEQLKLQNEQTRQQQSAGQEASQQGLIEDWSAGYKAGYAASRDKSADFNDGVNTGLEQLSAMIYRSSPEQLAKYKATTGEIFPQNSTLYRMINDLIDLRLNQLSSQKP